MNIKEVDVRIGNWLMMPFSGVSKLKKDDFGYIDNHAVNPIPIIPEILEKCGFLKTDYYHSKRIDEYMWLNIYPGGLFGFWSDSSDNESNFTFMSKGIRIEYVHQLQNLYFALTGTELEINLND